MNLLGPTNDTLATLISGGLLAPHLFARQHDPAYSLYRHIRFLGNLIASTIGIRGGRLLVNMGPRHGKSELLSYWTPAWHTAIWPHRRVLIGTHSSPLAEHYGGRVRDLFSERPQLGVKIDDSTRAKSEWRNTRGGGMKAIGVGEGAYGFGGDLVIVDDPYGTWGDAQSPANLRHVYDWFKGTLLSRLEPHATVIVLHHRLHPHDLTHQILTGDDGNSWRHVCLPSIAVEIDPLGRSPGEALCPERFPATALEAMRKSMGPAFDVMHQQNPLALSAGGAYSRFGVHNISVSLAFNPGLPLDISVDFNITPGMHVEIGQFDPVRNIAWVLDEIHGPRMSVDVAVAKLILMVQSMPESPTELRIFGDAAGAARWAGTGQTQYDILLSGLQRMGIPISVRVPRANPAVVDRVTIMQYGFRDIDGEVRYFVHPRCENLIRDLTMVQADPIKGIDKSNPELTHASDAEGYRMYELRGMPPIDFEPGRFVY